MNSLQKVLTVAAVVLAILFAYEWHRVKLAEAGPAALVRDINDHTAGGMLRPDVESYLAQRGGDVSYDPADASGRTSGVDHVIFRNIRHLGDSTEDLKADFFYDQGDHLTYYTMRRTWNRPKRQ